VGGGGGGGAGGGGWVVGWGGGGGGWVGAPLSISTTFVDAATRIALGGWGAVVGVGVAAGPVTGGLLLEHFSWSSVF